MFNEGHQESPTSMIKRLWEFFPVGVNVAIIAAIFIAAIFVGGQKLGFWLDNQNIKHTQQTQNSRNAIIQNSNNVQQGYVDAISGDVATIDSYIINAQGAPNSAMMLSAATGYGNEACLTATHLTGSYAVSSQMQEWINRNCSGGALKIDSPIRTGKSN